MSQQDATEPSEDVVRLGDGLADAERMDADARLELLRRIEAGIAEALDGLDGL